MISGRVLSIITFFLLLFFLTPQLLYAQNVEFTRDNFPDNPKELREARKEFKKGKKLYQQGGRSMYEALDPLNNAWNFNPDNNRLNFILGDIYLQTAGYDKAIKHLEKALDNGIQEKEAIFLLAKAYQMNYRFEEAIEYFRAYQNSLDTQGLIDMRAEIQKHILECRNGLELMADPERVFIDNPGEGINSPYDDYSPLISPAGEKIYFTSRRPLGRKNRLDEKDNKLVENVFIASKKDDSWQSQPINGKINTRSHDATSAISADGNTMIIYHGEKGGKLYESAYKRGRWSKPKKLPRSINSRYNETAAALSPDGNIFYFISDRPEGYGNKDIWFSTRKSSGRWKKPQNLGGIVNTEFDEEALFVSHDGNTLYFSSKGHNSMGGYDIFRTVYSDGQWSQPENLGYPVNSPSDDLFFVKDTDGETAYFSSLREGNIGGSDILKITFLGEEKPLLNKHAGHLIASKARPVTELTPDKQTDIAPPMIMLRGTVTDEESGDTLAATIELYDNEEETLLAEFQTNPETGAYYISLPGGKNYGIAVKAEGYLFHSENINIRETNIYREIINNVRLKKLEVGKSIVLNNIFFDSGKSQLRPESYAELGVLYKLLLDNENLKIEISGHTDNTGSATLNQRLSEERAKAVVEFLLEKGIDKDRLSYKGYGFIRPVASNDTEEGRQQNRRTEFEIIER